MKIQSKIRGHLSQRLTGQRGWTLIELLVGMMMMLAVFFAALPIIDGAANTEGRIQSQALNVGDARNFSDRILSDLRPAYDIGPHSSTDLTVFTWVRSTFCGSGMPSPSDAPPIKCMVTYSCSVDSCTRQERNTDGSGGGAAVTAISGLSDPNVFSYVQNGDVQDFVGITLTLPNPQDPSSNGITLTDGTALRNMGQA